MHSVCRCAVIAAMQPQEAAVLEGMLHASGFSEIHRAADGLTALRLIQQRSVDLLAADVILPALDGVSLAGRIERLGLPVYPGVLLMTVPGICPKTTAKLIEKPVRKEALADALAQLSPLKRRIPAGKRLGAERALDAIGIPGHCGREYLLRAVEMAWMDSRLSRALTTKLYPAVGEAFGVDGRHVERAIRHVIDEAWRSGEMEAQYRIFGDTIDAGRGSPTCGEMIAQIADILRWEGKV